jgi:23S rRNA pseudouridine1911/1915/1917 synthase
MTPPHKIPVQQAGRLDRLIADELSSFSRSKIQRLIEAGHASVNGQVISSPSFVVVPGQTVLFTEPEPEPDFPTPEGRSLTILHEDDDILIIDKPVGMVTHPNSFQESGTLVQAVLALRPQVAEAVYDAGNTVSRLRPGIVHRLDRDTSGLIVVAKNRPALLELAEQFHQRTIEKEYLTAVYGVMREPRTVNAPIQRKGGGSSNLMVASHDPGQGRSAVTHFTPLHSFAPYEKWPDEQVTLVRASIETGRTHQIRVHAKFIGHPVMGDQLYGNKPSMKLSQRLGLETQELRAIRLVITHPTTGERLTFTAPPSSSPLLQEKGQ